MNQDDFLRLFSKKADCTLQDASYFFETFLGCVNECVQNHESFSIINFGVLDYGKTKERTVHSKLFGDRTFPEVSTIYFRLSSNLKKLFKESNKITPKE